MRVACMHVCVNACHYPPKAPGLTDCERERERERESECVKRRARHYISETERYRGKDGWMDRGRNEGSVEDRYVTG